MKNTLEFEKYFPPFHEERDAYNKILSNYIVNLFKFNNQVRYKLTKHKNRDWFGNIYSDTPKSFFKFQSVDLDTNNNFKLPKTTPNKYSNIPDINSEVNNEQQHDPQTFPNKTGLGDRKGEQVPQ